MTKNPPPPRLPSLTAMVDMRQYFVQCPNSQCFHRFSNDAGGQQEYERHIAYNHHHIDESMSSSSVTDSDSAVTGSRVSPVSSRASSLSPTTQVSRQGSLPYRPARRRRQVSLSDADQRKEQAKLSKNSQAKVSRRLNRDVVCQMEDSLRHFARWERKEQNRGNGNGAGLEGLKLTILKGFSGVGDWAIHRLYTQAMRNGTLNQFLEEIFHVVENAVREDSVPHAGTFLEPAPGEKACRTVCNKSKECVEHNTPSWVACRKQKLELRFVRQAMDFERLEAANRGFGTLHHNTTSHGISDVSTHHEFGDFLAEEQATLRREQAILRTEQAQLREERAELREDMARLNEAKARIEEEVAQLQKEQAQLKRDGAQLTAAKVQFREQVAQFNQQAMQHHADPRTMPGQENRLPHRPGAKR